MSKRSRQTTGPVFADIVEDFKAAPAPTRPPRGQLIGPDGRCFYSVERELDPITAVALVADGAIVAWDSCGCQGYCELLWFEDSDRAELIRPGPPELRCRCPAGITAGVGN